VRGEVVSCRRRRSIGESGESGERGVRWDVSLVENMRGLRLYSVKGCLHQRKSNGRERRTRVFNETEMTVMATYG
jgi:hypothetical protein